MIRRIRAHAAKQDWFAVAVDLGIVVVGVYLGIQASNWNGDRHDRAEARELRAQLVNNLRINEADLRARSNYYRQVQTHAISALQTIVRRGRADDRAFLVDAYQASQIWRRPFERTAFNELENSGLSRKIGDMGTRTAISAYSVSADGFESTGLGVTSYREKLRRAMDLQTQDLIRTKCGDRMQRLSGGGQAPVLPDDCSLPMSGPSAQRAAERVRAIPELEQELTRLIVDIEQKQSLFDRMLRGAVELRKKLESH